VHIAIDYTPAVRQRAGIGRYTRGLVHALAELDRTNRYTLFCLGQGSEDAPGRQARLAGDEHGWPANFTIKVSNLPARWLTAGWHKLKLPLHAERLAGDSDIFHSPDFTLPPLRSAAGVVTIHDLSFLRLPEYADPGLREYLSKSVPDSVARARRVLADSENTRRDLIELLDVSRDKISVVTPGVGPEFRPVRDTVQLNDVRERYHLPQWFILFVGTIEPRKNLARLISAYGQLRRQTGLPHALVLAGNRGWLSEGIYEQVAKEGLTEHVLFPGFVADKDLPALYTLADLFTFPSLYEGFGIPPLEAMACGTPVVASNNSSLPEATGSAALLVDAEDMEGLADAMARVLGDAALRARLSDLGRAQAARFSWRGAAETLLRAYEATTG
jgi:glycosyltransferase involved in cell wall biosynthesis